MEHLAFAMVVLALAVAVSARLLGKYDGVPVLRKTGAASRTRARRSRSGSSRSSRSGGAGISRRLRDGRSR
jgi:hypothetical protein